MSVLAVGEVAEVPSKLVCRFPWRVFVENKLSEAIVVEAEDDRDGLHPKLRIKITRKTEES